MDLARRIIGPVSWMAPGLRSELVEASTPKLCLCDPCCGDPWVRWLALHSQGLDPDPEST